MSTLNLLRTDKERAEGGLVPAQCPAQGLEHGVPVLGQPAIDVDIVGVVVAGNLRRRRDLRQEIYGFRERLVWAEHLKPPGLDLGQHGGVDLGDEGPETHHGRLHVADDPGGLPGVGLGALLAADPHHDVGVDLKARGPGHLARPDVVPGGGAFFDSGQDDVVAGLHPDVNPPQPGLGQGVKLIRTFAVDVLGRTIDGDPLQPGKQGVAVTADCRQGRGRHGDGVAGGEKQGAHPGAIRCRGINQVRLDLGHRPDLELHAVFIDHAEGAEVVGAAHGGLDEQAVGFTGGPVNGAVVAHGEVPGQSSKFKVQSQEHGQR